MRLASTVTVVVFRALGTDLGADEVAAGVDDVVEDVTDVEGAGVDTLLASVDVVVLTVMSFPWTSMRAWGNSANLTSRAVGSRFLAKAYNESTGPEDGVMIFHSYCYGEVGESTLAGKERIVQRSQTICLA